MRIKKSKSLNNDSVVIVCEGTETENAYFEEMGRFSPLARIKVLPEPSQPVSTVDKERREMPPRSLESVILDGVSSKSYIAGVKDVDDVEYQKYKTEPLRWVRAADLLKAHGKFYEAWAVYDLDQGRAHEDAYEYIKSDENLHIAFSGYSIEEWFLLHFERNEQAYLHSECKKSEKIKCGHMKCDADWNCRGSKCLGGRLRECNYIPEYSKSDGLSLAKLTLDAKQRHMAYVNAAWSRFYSNGKITV